MTSKAQYTQRRLDAIDATMKQNALTWLQGHPNDKYAQFQVTFPVIDQFCFTALRKLAGVSRRRSTTVDMKAKAKYAYEMFRRKPDVTIAEVAKETAEKFNSIPLYSKYIAVARRKAKAALAKDKTASVANLGTGRPVTITKTVNVDQLQNLMTDMANKLGDGYMLLAKNNGRWYTHIGRESRLGYRMLSWPSGKTPEEAISNAILAKV